MSKIAGILKPSKGKAYVFFSIIAWFIAEYISVWHGKIGEWVAHMPSVFVYYLGYPLLFYYFIFRRRWGEKKIFILMLTVSLLLEISWKNPYFSKPTLFIPALFVLVSIYGFVTFIPLYIVEKSFNKYKFQSIYYLLWPVLGFFMSIFITNTKP